MNIKDVMTSDVATVTPTHSIEDAAKLMKRYDTGFLPVAENNELVGTLTDRDIVIRVLAAGRDGATPVSKVMTRQVLYCFEAQDTRDVARNMGEIRVRRLPVVDRDKRLVGIVSLGDLSAADARRAAGDALRDLSS